MRRVCELAAKISKSIGTPTDGDDISLTWEEAQMMRDLAVAVEALPAHLKGS
jgi:hypothetical protein